MIFCWLKSANHKQFTEECVMLAEKHVLVKNVLQMDNKYECATASLNRKAFHGVERH